MRARFAELLRVLRPGGTMIFTVPMHDGAHTIERARQRDGAIEYLLEPVYHLDLLRPEGILAFRDYGRDIVDRLRAAGFVDARILAPSRRLDGSAVCRSSLRASPRRSSQWQRLACSSTPTPASTTRWRS